MSVFFSAKRLPKSSVDQAKGAKASLVCATHNRDPKLAVAIETWLANKPHDIIIAASPSAFEYVKRLTADVSTPIPIKVIKASTANKRVQLCEGFRMSRMPVIVAVDDDTTWTLDLLPQLVSPLLSPSKIGCVFPDLRVRTSGTDSTVWERLSLLRHAGGGVNLHASHYIDGGLYCNHGATSAYRAEILQDENFITAFTQETWGDIRLNNGDDQYLTRWLERHGWESEFLPVREGIAHTAARNDWTLFLQLLRWSRGDWRSNLSALIWEKKIWM